MTRPLLAAVNLTAHLLHRALVRWAPSVPPERPEVHGAGFVTYDAQAWHLMGALAGAVAAEKEARDWAAWEREVAR